ncbi:MAG: diguanylate cyclase [Ketobacteraceae bacterium]|nr:diguanylate cyclase [Ketobacteraceae bacterium]
MIRAALIIHCLFACMLLSANVSALIVSVGTDFESITLGPGLHYLVEPENVINVSEIMDHTGWKEVSTPQASFGFRDKAYWLRFAVENPQNKPEDLLIELSNNYLDSINLYVLDEEKQVIAHQQSGDSIPYRLRPIAHAQNLHPVTLPAKARITIVIRVQSSSALSIPVQIWDRQAFTTYDFTRTVGLGIFFGLMIIFSLYHLVVAALTRDSSALYYAIFIFSFLMIFSYRKGIPPSILPEAAIPSMETANVFGISLVGFSLCLFTSRILLLKDAAPALARLMLIAGSLALLPLFASRYIDYSLLIRISLGYSLIIIVLFATVIIKRIRDRYPPARHMVIASIFGIIGGGSGILAALDILPVTLTVQTLIYVCNAVMALFLALTISYRINMDRQLIEEAQRKHTHELDELVRRRTEELESVNAQLHVVSITDGLTQLYNRRYFDETFRTEYNRAFREKQPLSVLLMDIDHFKKLNDTHGHAFGDLCLKTAAEVVQSQLRRPLDVAARYGGEEFVVLLPDTDTQGACHIAENIRRELKATVVHHNGKPVNMTISAGVSGEIPVARDQHEALLKRADDCLYEAKRNGRDRVETES